jgi:hypothetical protein
VSILPEGYAQTAWANEPLGTVEVDAAGVARVTTAPVPNGEIMLVERIVITVAGSVAQTAFGLYLGEPGNESFRDGTANGNRAAAEYPRGLLVQGGQYLVGLWTDGDPGALATLTAQYVRAARRR